MDDWIRRLELQGYHLFGEHQHSATKPCLWLKKAMRGGEFCYKGRFYGVASHRCIQMTPTILCNQACIHCWRPFIELSEDDIVWDTPSELIQALLLEHRRILSGYGGSDTTDTKRLREATEPKHVAISLIGEPTIYPYLPAFIDELNALGYTTFLVTNGTNPEMLRRVRPTQAYLSLNAPNRDLYERICHPDDDYWERIMESLETLSKLRTRKVIRLTMIKGVNMIDPDVYARLIHRAEPDFIEVKSYMHLGYSRMRLDRSNMPSHNEIREFTGKIVDSLDGYAIEDESEISRVVLVMREDFSDKRFLEV